MNDITYTIHCVAENTPIRGNASAIDAATDLEVEAWIYAQLRAGNGWAWCAVMVRASIGGHTGDDYLGCCSYVSEADFCASGYYQSMCDTARANLIANIRDARVKGREATALLRKLQGGSK